MQKQSLKPKTEEFHQRLDFYWQYIAVYSVILIIYSFLRGTIKHNTISVVISDPIVLLLSAFIIASALAMLISYYRRKAIIIGSDYVIFKNRLREKKFTAKDIQSIIIGKEKLFKVRRGVFKVIRIVLVEKRRVIRIRPSTFNDENELVESFTRLKKGINK